MMARFTICVDKDKKSIVMQPEMTLQPILHKFLSSRNRPTEQYTPYDSNGNALPLDTKLQNIQGSIVFLKKKVEEKKDIEKFTIVVPPTDKKVIMMDREASLYNVLEKFCALRNMALTDVVPVNGNGEEVKITTKLGDIPGGMVTLQKKKKEIKDSKKNSAKNRKSSIIKLDYQKVVHNWENLPEFIKTKLLATKISQNELEKEMELVWYIACWLFPEFFCNWIRPIPTLYSEHKALPETEESNPPQGDSEENKEKHTDQQNKDSPTDTQAHDQNEDELVPEEDAQPLQEFSEINRHFIEEGRKRLKPLDCPVRKRFKMLSEAGAGGYGTIFEAKDIVHNKVVVVKRIDHQGKRTQYHNYNEIGILSAISHKNIVTYYDAILYFNEKKNIEEAWIVMEFLQGGSLQECSSALRLGFTHIAYIIREILLALEYLHKMGLAHRDLKSSNVMIGVDGDIKLIDFGLCEDMSSGPRYGTLGSPYWLSPEMIKQQSHSFATDIWSLGVCLIELILGDVPFDTPLKCMFKTATVGLHESIPKDIPEMTKDFLKQCLTQDQFQRPTSSALLQHPWLLVPGLADGIKDALDAIFVSKLLTNYNF